MDKALKILEVLWLIIGLVGLALCVNAIIDQDQIGATYFLVFTVVCGIMYAIRKRQRIKHETSVANQSLKAKERE